MDPRRAIRRLDHLQRQRRIPAVAIAVFRKYSDDRGGRWAALISYFGFFSLFPLLLVFVTLLGLVLREDEGLRQRLIDSALSQFPIIGPQIESNIRALTGSAQVILVGLVVALWTGTAVVTTAQAAMDELWNVPRRDQPPAWKARLKGVAMLSLLGAAMSISGFITAFGATHRSLPVQIFAFLFVLGLDASVLTLGFRLLTEADVGWKMVFPGAVVGAIAWVALLASGAFIVDRHLRNASELYGFFAIVLGLLSWIYLVAQVTLLCAELNTVLARRLWPRGLLPDDPTEADLKVLSGEVHEEAARPDQVVDVRFEAAQRTARH